jgi:hypothetical protein
VSATEVNSNSNLDPVQAEVHTEFDQFIKTFDIAEPVSFEAFINPAAEELDMHAILSDSEIVELYQDAQEVDEEQEAAENISLSPYVSLSKEEKIVVLAKAIAIFEPNEDEGLGIHWQ